jgi:1,4-dihydroxy-2-naphthoate octaprenyltransferase
MFICISVACDAAFAWQDTLLPALISSMLVGGFYPLTQVYQHEADLRDGVKTISYVLGYRGTFIFSGIVYSLAMALLFYYYLLQGEPWKFVLFIVMMAPVPWFFMQWAMAVWKNNAAADFSNTMKLNVIASVCTNIAFLSILISQFFE